MRDPLADLLTRVAVGDRAAFEELYRLTSGRLFATCLRVLTDRSEAEDVLQESYVAVWRRASSFDRTRGGALSWLVSIARNQAIDRVRAARRPPSGVDAALDVRDPAPNAVDVLLFGEEERRLAACIEALESEGAILVRTAYLGDLTYSEVARRSATPLGTVKTRIRRALASLRACME